MNNKKIQQRDDSPQNPLVNFTGIRISPVPPPAEMREYERLNPVDLLEEQSRHRIELERIVVNGNNRRANIAQILSFILVMVVLVGGVILLFKGKDGVGFASIITALTAFFGGAILRKRDKRQEKD
jgi:hypothetical protein